MATTLYKTGYGSDKEKTPASTGGNVQLETYNADVSDQIWWKYRRWQATVWCKSPATPLFSIRYVKNIGVDRR